MLNLTRSPLETILLVSTCTWHTSMAQITYDQIETPRTPKPRIPDAKSIWHYIDVNWRYPSAEKRDLRLDLMRGFAVIVMVVDHFGGSSWLYLVTGGNAFFTSGAEAFVLISGMVVGMVYGAIALRDGPRSAIVKALSRAWTLYKLTVVLTIGFAVISELLDLPWSHGYMIGNPLEFVLNVIILHETYYLADIPLLYTILMAVAPIGLWLLYRHHTKILLTGSFLLWLGYQIVDANQIVIWPTIGSTTFHPASWQLIFFYAMAVGYHRDMLFNSLREIPRWPYFVIATVLFIALVHLYSTDLKTLERLYPGVDINAIVTTLFNKSNVAPGRIVATVIVFQFMYVLLSRFWVPLYAVFGWILSPLGQNSLYSYTMHVVIIGGFYMLLPYLPGHLTERGTINTMLQLSVLVVLWWLIRRQFAFDIVPR
jgi:hypothetical protein